MATGNAWLQKQRKPDLADIADHLGLKNHSKFRKMDLEMSLEQFLRDNQTALESDPRVAAFYQGVDPASPVKHNPGVSEKKPRQRRQTLKAKEELEAPSSSSSPSPPSTTLTTTTTAKPRTPARAPANPHTIPLPPSPSLLADQIETHTTTLLATLATTLTTSPLPPLLSTLRTHLSHPTSIALLALALEAYGLRTQVLPLRYLTTTPALPLLNLPPLALKIPDLFALLTGAFWGPVSLWVLTSVVLPLGGGWFFNLRGEGGYDAVGFNVVKGLVAWVVYVCEGVGGESRGVVERGVMGGGAGMLVGAGVGGVAAIYEAVLRR